MAFTLPIKLSSSQPVFSHFYLSDSVPDSAAGESAWPPCQLRLSNNRSEVNTVVRFLHFHIIILDVSSGNLFFQTESLMADS